MALTATIYNIEIDLADSNRGVYENLALRVACHPSESEEYLLTRVLAYALEYGPGIEFSRGLSTPDEPPVSIRDATGTLQAWIDVGSPEAARLHKASKAAPRVAVYVHKDPRQFLERLAGERIHRAGAIEIWEMDRDVLRALVAKLERRMTFSVSVSDHDLFLAIGSDTLTGTLRRHHLE